jgi:hypothetical protein
MMLRLLTALLGMMLMVPAVLSAYLPRGTEASAGCRNIVLAYNSWESNGHLHWKRSDFLPLLACVSPSGRVTAPLFDGILVLPLVADSGRGFIPGFGTGPVNKADWDYYLEQKVFGGQNHLAELEAAALITRANYRVPHMRWKVILTLLYPDRAQRDWGKLDTGTSLDLAYPADRLKAIQYCIDRVTTLWNQAGFTALDFVGWYWLEEAVRSPDTTLMPSVAEKVHYNGKKFFWIPYYKAAGSSSWKLYGFDAVMHQPNYFFTDTLPESRLTDASAYAKANGMGVELEFDGSVMSSSAKRAKYRAYLAHGATDGYQKEALTAWYMGASAMMDCARSTVADVRAMYDETVDFIAGEGYPGDSDGSGMITLNDIKLALRIGAGFGDSAGGGVVFENADADASGRIDFRDAALIARYMYGLQTTMP